MAANYWDSTQAKFWTFTKPELTEIRRDLEKANQPLYSKNPLPDRRVMNIYLQQQLTKLARRMSLRQQPIATAQVYLKRFYLRVEMRRTNPYLIMATAMYLACKMEESPQHIRLMLGEAARQWPELGVSDTSKIGECEFALISTLSSRLICHHPYRSLAEFTPLFSLTSEENQLAHSIINDSYNTDLLLLYPPHVIAITAIFLALVLKPPGPSNGLQAHPGHVSTAQSPTGSISPNVPNAGFSPAMSSNVAQQAAERYGGLLRQSGPRLNRMTDWLAESKVDMSAIIDATQEMISLYDVWEHYNERLCKEAITKFIKDASSLSNSNVGPK